MGGLQLFPYSISDDFLTFIGRSSEKTETFLLKSYPIITQSGLGNEEIMKK